MGQDKVNEYYNKQYIISKRKEELEDIQKVDQNIKQKDKLLKDKKIEDILKTNENQINNKKCMIMEKIQQKDNKVYIVSKIKELGLMKKNELQNLKIIDREENIKRISRMQDYNRVKTLRRIDGKTQHFNDFKFIQINLEIKKII